MSKETTLPDFDEWANYLATNIIASFVSTGDTSEARIKDDLIDIFNKGRSLGIREGIEQNQWWFEQDQKAQDDETKIIPLKPNKD